MARVPDRRGDTVKGLEDHEQLANAECLPKGGEQ